MNAMDALTKTLLSSPDSGKLISRIEAVIRAANAPEGRALIAALADGGGMALQRACAQSKDAPNAAKALINALAADSEGTKLISAVLALAGRRS